MKRELVGIISVSLVLCACFPTIIPSALATVGKRWALIICGSEGGSFSNDTQYMYHVLHDHYRFNGIAYLDVYTGRLGVNASSTRMNVSGAITVWLQENSGPHDLVFIYFASHGTGYNKNNGLESGRVETGGADEGNETLESVFRLRFYPLNVPWDINGDGIADRLRDINTSERPRDGFIEIDFNDDGSWNAVFTLLDIDNDGLRDDLYGDVGTHDCCNVLIDADTNGDGVVENWASDGEDLDNDGFIVGVDFNGNGNQSDWVGVDEGLNVLDGVYWDDELASDLSTVSYQDLIFVRQGCLEGNMSCFGGGLIDDISAPSRIIMTSSNETWYSYGDLYDNDGISEWSKGFIDALHGQEAYWNGTQIVHETTQVNADLDGNGYVTLYEDWQYAWNHDQARINGLETPWFDDNGNGLPTFRNGADQLDSSDGDLARQMVLEPNLSTILNKLGFTNVAESTTETFPRSHYNVTLYTEFASYHMSNNLSWYPTGTADYHLIFDGPEGRFGYVSPPITKSIVSNSTFGLSFFSPEARYYTETSKNPDQLKHAQVYLNNANPKMYLIGFENGLGSSDGDYNDMVIALENVNNPPSVPLISGNSRGYVYTNYTCIANSTDPEGDNVYYLFNWGDGTNSTVGPAQSHANTTATHQWTRPGTYNVTATSRDTYGASNNQSSSPLVLNVTQNDNGCLGDASNTHASATTYSQGVPTGALYNSSPADTQDWYKFYANSGNRITIDMTPPSGIDFDLSLYRKNDSVNSYADSWNPSGYSELINCTANETGWWRAKIFESYVNEGDGQYTFHVSVTAPGGGGCPYVYAWNGTSYVKDNNILPASENGNGTDVEDHYKLEQPLVPFFQGQQVSLYSLQLLEFEHEHDYIDQVNLFAVDHSQGTSIAVTPEGEILTYQNPVSPASCVDNYGNSRLSEVGRMDGNVSMQSTFFQGYAGDWLLLNFGRVTAENAKLILRDDQKCADVCINVQVPDQAGNWQTVEVLHPRDYWAIEAVNLTAHVPANGDFIVRLLWTATHRLDYVGLDTTSQEACEFHQASLFLAVHSTEGNVIRKILENDQIYTELVPGERIQLAFFLPSNQNQERTFILYTEGHYNPIT